MPMLGLADLSCALTISSTVPSPMPAVLSVRVIRMEPGWRRRSSGATSFSHMRVISVGGPGIATMILPSRSTHHPGAVPRGLGMARAEGMTQHCLTLRSGIA